MKEECRYTQKIIPILEKIEQVPMKKILFPTDFSATAENAFLYALALSRATGAELTLVHVYELPELGRSLKTTTKEVYEMMEMESLDNFKAAVKKLHSVAESHGMGEIEFNQAMIEGEAVYKISRAAAEMQADMVVMGTKGATGLKEIFLGSITTGVIEECHVPVLSIPDGASYSDPIGKVAYLTNYKPEEVKAFESVCNFSGLFNANVVCVHFDISKEEDCGQEMEKWKSQIAGQQTDVEFLIEKGTNLEDALVQFKVNHHVDIIAVQPRKKNLFTRLFSKSVSKQIAHHIQVPLLTLPVE
jgi:nucleotide-binding universal stress UspA family protein